MSTIETPVKRRVQRVRHELLRREVTVERKQEISPGFLAITFRSPSLQSFTSLGFDDHVKFIFNTPAGEQVARDYTPRSFRTDIGELTLEFVLHEGGQASDWAVAAQPGSQAIIGGPRGSMVIPTDYDWHLLIGDATALPAIHRRLEELPPETPTIVLCQVESPTDHRLFGNRPNTSVAWVYSADSLLLAARALQLPQGEGFAWGAGEAQVMTEVRRLLRERHNHPSQAMRVAAYWRKGARGFHEELAVPTEASGALGQA